MLLKHSSKLPHSAVSLIRLLLSVALPVLMLLAFLGAQFIHFDTEGWNHGFNHPLMGWDHLVTMLAVGIWAAQLRGKAIWMLPMAFVGVMSLGGLAGAAGLAIPSVEGIILLSCAVFSILITRKIRFTSSINVLIVAFFAFFHGFAHGQEISTSASLISYTLGFMLATLLLHGTGILVAKLVIFAISCLLSMLFSTTALANTAKSVLDVQVKSTFIDQAVEIHKSSGIRQATEQIPPDQCCAVLFATAVKSQITSSLHGLSQLKSDSFQIAHQCLHPIHWYSFAVSPANLAFKYFFPDINHTPGHDFLSNGVGLTSPPCHNPFALQCDSCFSNTSDLSSLAAAFQLIAAFSLGKHPLNSKFIHLSKDFIGMSLSAVNTAIQHRLTALNRLFNSLILTLTGLAQLSVLVYFVTNFVQQAKQHHKNTYKYNTTGAQYQCIAR